MRKKQIAIVLIAAMLLGLLTACGTPAQAETSEIAIVYTNDIHGYVENTVTVDDKEVNGLRLSNVAQYVKDLRAEGKDVLLVDAGDEIQGGSYGAYDEGQSIIRLMNAAGYQLAAPGNHDFDYGVHHLFQIAEQAEFSYISCNFHTLEETADGDPFAPYEIFDLGGRKVAFVGISTPQTITATTPVYFQDSEGRYIYQIDGMEKAEDMYAAVQKTIDAVREEADIVIALGHVGIDNVAQKNRVSSYDVIAHTTGLDAFIDGHSHTTMPQELVANQDGHEVLLTQTGFYLNAFGVMRIDTAGNITTELVTEYEGTDETVAAIEAELYDLLEKELETKIAVSDTEMTIFNPREAKQRLIRSREMNIGDLVADSIYWYFNEDRQIPCNVAVANGGGIRTTIAAGDVTFGNIKDVMPFNNMICLILASGQQILDALELGTTAIGEWDSVWNRPAENGGFLQVAGMRYTIDTTIPSSVVTDSDGMFCSVDGEYRVRDVEIYNRTTGVYEPMDLNAVYTIGGINYLLRNSGNGLSMFRDCDMVVDYVGQDCDIFSDYLMSFTPDGEYSRINTQNSPLSAYPGYQLDYENPFGADRITIIME